MVDFDTIQKLLLVKEDAKVAAGGKKADEATLKDSHLKKLYTSLQHLKVLTFTYYKLTYLTLFRPNLKPGPSSKNNMHNPKRRSSGDIFTLMLHFRSIQM